MQPIISLLKWSRFFVEKLLFVVVVFVDNDEIKYLNFLQLYTDFISIVMFLYFVETKDVFVFENCQYFDLIFIPWEPIK